MSQKDYIFLALIALLAVAVYANGLKGEFIYDDVHYILNNKQVLGEDSIFGCPTPSDRPYLGLYRPLVVLTYRLNWLSSGFLPSAFHGTNVVLHLLAACALYLLVRALSGSREGAFLGGLLFAVHPVHAEAVSWTVGRAEIMAALFCLLTAILHLGARRRPWLAAPAAAAFLAACLCKENALAFPAVLVLMDLLVRREENGRPGGEKAWRPPVFAAYAAYALVLAAVAVVRVSVIGTFGPPLETTPYGALSLLERIPVALSILAESLRLFVFPVGLRIFYHASEMRDLGIVRIVVLAVFALLVIGFLLKWGRRRGGGSSLLFWLLWIPATLATVLNVVPIGAVFAERFLYLPSAGACAVLGLALSRLCVQPRARAVTVWILVLLVLGLGAITWSRNPAYHDPVSLWEDAVRKADFPYTHYNLGESYFEKGIYDYLSPERTGAVQELKRSLDMDPRHQYASHARVTLGKYYLNVRNDVPRAVAYFRAAVADLEQVAVYPELASVCAELARIGSRTRGEAVSIEEALEYAAIAGRAGFRPEEMEALKEELEEIQSDGK